MSRTSHITGLCLTIVVASGILRAFAQPTGSTLAQTTGKPVRTQEEVEAVGREVLARYADKRLASYGILDVTKAPYSADPNGQRNATEALQRALTDARDARLVTFLPPGTYRVSNTLTCVQGYVRPVGEVEHRLRSDSFPCILWGSTRGGRARLFLAPNSPGFDTPATPKPLLFFTARSWEEPHDLQPNVSFNQMIVSIDVEFGAGNSGAIGIDHQAAQGSVVEDVRVNATGGFAGLRGAPGSGGGMSHISVQGGEYGLYVVGIGALEKFQGSQPAPVISHVTLRGQTRQAILYDGRGPLTIVGGWIEGAGIRAQAPSWARWDGHLNLVDCIVSFRQSGPVITASRSVYLNNVYLEDAGTVVQFDSGVTLRGTPRGWTHVREYAAGATPQNPIWLDGQRRQQPLEDVALNVGSPPQDLQTQHAWIEPFPSWEDDGIANVREAPYGARGDGNTDDTSALQRAIDEHQTVFLPKGVYRISRPLSLRADTRLVGVAGAYAVIVPVQNAPAFSNPVNPSPLVSTVNDANAATVLAFVQLRSWIPGAYALHWQAGRNSVVRNVWFHRWPWVGAGVANHPNVLVDGHGGGRWYNVFNISYWNQGPNYRHFLVQGTREPLVFYMFNPEHAASNYHAEFNDVEDVTIYGMKAESAILPSSQIVKPPLLVRNAGHVRIFGYGGVAWAAAESSLFRIEGSDHFLLANIAPQHIRSGVPPTMWSTVVDVPPTGEPVRTPGTEWFVLYKRGKP